MQEEPGGGRPVEILHAKGQNVLNFVSQGLNLVIDEVRRPRGLLLLVEGWGRREGLRHGERRIVLLLSINKDLWSQIKGMTNLLLRFFQSLVKLLPHVHLMLVRKERIIFLL